MTIEEKLKEMETMIQKATLGPWKWMEWDEAHGKTYENDDDKDDENEAWLYNHKKEEILEYSGCGSHGCSGLENDKDFISQSRTDWPRCVEALTVATDGLRMAYVDPMMAQPALKKVEEILNGKD